MNTIAANRILFADIILPRPIPKLLTYGIPTAFSNNITKGSRVIVPFGVSKFVTGIVADIHSTVPSYVTKDIIELLDEVPVMNPLQLSFFNWLAQYYMCTMGEVLQAALPAGLKLDSKSRIQLNPDFFLEAAALTENEYLLLKVLHTKSDLSYSDVSLATGQKNPHRLIKSLINKKAILLFEEIKDKYAPKRMKRVCLNEAYILSDESLKKLFSKLEGRKTQLDVLLKYITQVPLGRSTRIEDFFIDKQKLSSVGISLSSLETLIKHNIFIEDEVSVSRFCEVPEPINQLPALSQLQSETLSEIYKQFKEKQAVLLHGVTGSGKTEIYIHLIKEAIEGGGQVLYLLPEIAITTQMVSRLQKFFGNKMGIYHSKYSEKERVEVWNGVIDGKFPFVLGVRSAIFLPFNNLSLIIVDEEHETSYKQFESMPRYHARDAAVVLGQYHNAKVLLGSATPSLESYFNARSGKYGLVDLKERFGVATLPEISFANVCIERERKTMHDDFTKMLLDELAATIENGEQAIIFQNRRGYAPHITCQGCAWVPTCTQCAVSLTYHQMQNHLCCHYCGYRIPMPAMCSVCNSPMLKNVGFGTEKLEETLQTFFPQKDIKRMDSDTTRGKHSYEKLIRALEQGKTDILVGTQMITKGLDFGQVALVGVMDVDRLIYFPDFRANERCFQLVTQVAGRAGRREKQGKVIIQTANPNHPILKAIVQNDYMQMYTQELKERKEHLYPPYVRLLKITLKNALHPKVTYAAKVLFENLSQKLGNLVLGPQTPVISKIRHQYIMNIWVKIQKQTPQQSLSAKAIVMESVNLLYQKEPKLKSVRIVFDVDPI